jgi:hypothetical protein
MALYNHYDFGLKPVLKLFEDDGRRIRGIITGNTYTNSQVELLPERRWSAAFRYGFAILTLA